MGRYLTKVLGLLLAILFLTGCPDEEASTSDRLIIGEEETEITPVDPDTYVCDPFSGDPDDPNAPDVVTTGLKGKLYYREDDQPRYYSAQDYFDFTTPYEDLTLYLSHVEVPTRPFDRGFVTEGGLTLTTVAGDTLYEYFALDMESRLTLADGDVAGEYQLAILSDDGAVLQFDHGAGYETFIDNDGDHPTRMACATSPVTLDATSALPFRLKYYQGPRFHISLILMYRPWSEADHDDVECGRQGNSRYFRYWMDPPEPTSTYEGLLARGWKVLTPNHFLLPESGEENPCVDPEEPDPEVLDLNIGMVGRTEIQMNWVTNTATTSQLRIVNLATSETTFTTQNPALVTNHTETATGLTPNMIYQLTAISTDAQGRTVESNTVTVRTQR